MLFPHEKIQEKERLFANKIVEMKKDLPKSNILYSIAVLAEENDFVSSYDRYVIIYLSENHTLLSINNLLDQIEEEILFDWKLDLDRCNMSIDRHGYYYNHPEKKFNINIDFINSQCKTIKTGKLIPETKQICTLADK